MFNYRFLIVTMSLNLRIQDVFFKLKIECLDTILTARFPNTPSYANSPMFNDAHWPQSVILMEGGN